MFKKLLNLFINFAPLKQWQMEIGSYLLRKGCGFEIGQIIRERKIGTDLYRVKVVTELFYDFKTNQINHRKENRIISSKAVEVTR
jgi:hypothetical protein